MPAPKYFYRCSACGRVWAGKFEQCQKCGQPTVMIDEAGNVVADKISHAK